MQPYTIFFVTVNALHVSGGFSALHQELKNCTHSIGYMSSLLAATTSFSFQPGKEMWRWTQGHLATMLPTHSCCIPDDWPLCPRFSLWPPQRHGAVLWVLAYFVYYRVQHPTTPTLQDFADFMRRARWKAHPLPQRCKRVGNYLTVLETSPIRSAPDFYVNPMYRRRRRKSPHTTHNENLTIRCLVFVSVVGLKCMRGGIPPLFQQ
jgi:hypothetical protein